MSDQLSRREFMQRLTQAISLAAMIRLDDLMRPLGLEERPVVSIVKVKRSRVSRAVVEAIDLLGGIDAITEGQERIMLKPNLVTDQRYDTTNPAVVRTLAHLMKNAGKDVSIGEGSAQATGFNAGPNGVHPTWDPEVLIPMQQAVFDRLGYTDIAKDLDIPLVNLHTGRKVTVDVPDGFVFDSIDMHHALTEIDMLVSVPRMKTHGLAGVTLGMKNLIGLYPGEIFGSVRWMMHDMGAQIEPSGTAVCIVDMVRANKLGLTVIDGILAMEGDGPTYNLGTRLVKMDLIIAGTNPLATDMVAASIMGFDMDEIPTFEWAIRAGMLPSRLEDIEVRGESIAKVRHFFRRPTMYTWQSLVDTAE